MSQTFSAADLPKFLADLKRERFYGRVSFDIKNGDVTLIRKEETVLVNYNQEGANRNASGNSNLNR